MQSKKRWLIPAAVAALIITGGSAVACGHGNNDGSRGGRHSMQSSHFGGHGGQLRGAYRVSNLSDQQRNALDKIFDATQDQKYEKMKSWRSDRRALREAMRSGADAATIKPLADKAGQHMAEMIVMRAETRAKVYAVLTPEQRTQLAQMSQHGKRGSAGRPGPRGNAPMAPAGK